jgi:hypothetical protein
MLRSGSKGIGSNGPSEIGIILRSGSADPIGPLIVGARNGPLIVGAWRSRNVSASKIGSGSARKSLLA